MCDPNCPCLEDEKDDNDSNRRPRRRKKKGHKLDPCHQKPPLPPDDPDSLTPLPTYRKVTPNGQLEEPKPFEAVLNWQTQNAKAQNSTFRSLDEKIEKVASQVKQTDTKVDKITSQLEQMYLDMQNRVIQLDSDLRFMIQNRYWGLEFNKKEAEIRQLKAELARIDADKQQPSLFAKSPALPLPTPTFELADISKLLMAQPSTGSNDPSSSSPPQTPIVEEANLDTNPTASHQENSSPKPSNSPWFTFDDIPRVKWPTMFEEFFAWIDVQMLRTGATPQTVLKEFSSCFMGSLRDWFESLGQYRQLQLIQAEISQVLGLIYEQFLGEITAANEQIRREFCLMKCYSLQIRDLDFHYKMMSTMYYKLNGFNDPSLKHVFVASLPKEIKPELQRQFTVHQLDIANLSLEKIYQLAVNCLERLCEQKEFFKDLMENKQPFKSACFWQLGIHPHDRPKTAFYIPNVHYQWKVMPFGLKDGYYSPGPYIAQELIHFPDEHLSKKQIQQFLGIINYLREFFPHVAVHTSQLSKMLMKTAPPWGPPKTTVIRHLKQIAQHPPPLKILTDG
ncbi:hypothetical protein KPL71_001159 [Citrus sinensis]|nr:hypothetical protein KPL71_001159 [Citrus sinensis]